MQRAELPPYKRSWTLPCSSSATHNPHGCHLAGRAAAAMQQGRRPRCQCCSGGWRRVCARCQMLRRVQQMRSGSWMLPGSSSRRHSAMRMSSAGAPYAAVPAQKQAPASCLLLIPILRWMSLLHARAGTVAARVQNGWEQRYLRLQTGHSGAHVCRPPHVICADKSLGWRGAWRMRSAGLQRRGELLTGVLRPASCGCGCTGTSERQSTICRCR
jgi:hypothetical protein